MRGACLLAAIVSLGGVAHAQSFEAAFSAWLVSTERAVSAVRVDTQQHSVSARQTTSGASVSSRALANTIVEQSVARQSLVAISNAESMQNGTSGLCANVAMAAADQSATSSGGDVRSAVSQFEVDWASNGGSRSELLAATQDIRRGVLCSPLEMSAGLCNSDAWNMMGVVPAGDTNAAPWLLRRSYGTQEAELGSIYIDTVAPPPTMESAAEASASVDQLLRRAEARRQLALLSISRGAMMDVVLGGLQGGVE